VEENMDRSEWSLPVTFETERLGAYLTISSTAEAARVLLEHWPLDRGKALKRAKAACLLVLQGKADAEIAREAFMKAAAEADVFVRP
jgi:hypothetical protein